MLTTDYERLPTSTKFKKVIAGLLPPYVTWQTTGSAWYAVGVFIAGFIAGYIIDSWYMKFAFRDVRRDATGQILPEDFERALKRSLPVFLWAGPVCGAFAAFVVIWFAKY